MGKKTKDFSRNPFKSLKGFCVSAPETPVFPKERKNAAGPSASAEADDFTSFAEEMKRLGLPQPEREPDLPEVKRPEGPKGAQPPSPRTDRDLFLAALGEMDVTFTDHLPDEEEGPRAEPRRMRQLRQGRLVPEAQLDLHGFSRSDARAKALFFLENAVHHGMKTVLLVTGRGLGSAGEPVLRAEMEHLLSGEGSRLVSEWGRAPRQYGGDGALVVFLRGPRGG